MDNWYSVKATCANDDCTIHHKPTRAKSYEGEVAPHHMMLVVLYGHTQHGGCGFNVEVDGEAWPIRSQ